MSFTDAAQTEKGDFSPFHHQAEGLKRLAQVINAYPSQQQTLAQALQIIAETLGVKRSVLLNFDSKRNKLVPLSPAYGFEDIELKLLSQEFAKSEVVADTITFSPIFADAFLEGEATLSNEPQVFQREDGLSFAFDNCLVVPVQVESQVRGLCIAADKSAGIFDNNDLEMLLALTGILATLFKNLNLVHRLQGSQRRHLAVLDAAVDGFVEVGRDFKITLFSKGAENLTGWSAEEALGRTCSEVLMPHNPNGGLLCLTCPLRRSFRNNTPVANVETLIHTHEGEDNWVSCSYNAVTDENGEIVSGVIAIKDIYRIKALSDELRQQIQQQESLLGVINAINGLSSIEEIYSRALGEVANAINFDLGLIHSIKENQELELMAISEPEVLPPAAPLEGNYFGPDYFPSPEEDGDPSFPSPIDNLDPRIFQILEAHRRDHAPRPRRSESPRTVLNGRTYHSHNTFLKASHNCEALRQNEPYMSVNLPGKEICGVLEDFEGIKSHLCVPIKTQEKTYAVLHLASYRPYAFWGSDFALALSICKQIAVAAERAHLFEQIDMLARTDPLTKLYNKREFWDRIDREMKRAERQRRPLSLMIIDLDRLKWYNDFFGHSHGDVLLAKIGQLIREKCRNTDIAFRYGGDEMCLLLPDTGPREAFTVAERIRKAAIELQVGLNDDLVIGIEEEENQVTMSIGLASFPGPRISNATDLFESADSAMYRAKETGKNRSVIFDPNVDINKLNYRRRVRPSEYVDDRLKLPSYNPGSPSAAETTQLLLQAGYPEIEPPFDYENKDE